MHYQVITAVALYADDENSKPRGQSKGSSLARDAQAIKQERVGIKRNPDRLQTFQSFVNTLIDRRIASRSHHRFSSSERNNT